VPLEPRRLRGRDLDAGRLPGAASARGWRVIWAAASGGGVLVAN